MRYLFLKFVELRNPVMQAANYFVSRVTKYRPPRLVRGFVNLFDVLNLAFIENVLGFSPFGKVYELSGLGNYRLMMRVCPILAGSLDVLLDLIK
jgi:hypothetical protein